jgi:hypothetical protein
MSASSAESAPPSAPVKRRRGILWRLIRWGLAALFIFLLLCGGVLYWAYTQRDDLAGKMITKLTPGYAAKVTGFDVSPERVTAHEVSLVDPLSGKELGQVAELSWKPEWLELAKGKVGDVSVRGVTVKTDAATLRRWLAASAHPQVVAEGVPASPVTGLSIAKADLSSLHIEVEGDERTPSFKLEAGGRIEGLDTHDPANPQLKLASLQIHSIEATLPDGTECRASEFDLITHIDSARGALVVEKVMLPGCRVHLSPALNAWLAQLDEGQSAAKPGAGMPAWLKVIEVQDAAIPEAEIQADEGLPKWLGPLLGSVKVSYSGKGFRWSPGQFPELGAQVLRIEKLNLRPKTGSGGLRCDSASVKLGNEGATARLQIDEWELDRPVIEWTPDLEAALIVPAAVAADSSEATEALPWSILMKQGALKDAEVKISPTVHVPFRGGFKLTGVTKDLTITAEGAKSRSVQSWTLSDVSLRLAAAAQSSPQLIAIEKVVASVVPDQWQEHGLIDEVTVTKPIVVLNDATLPPSPPTTEVPDDPPTPQSLNRWWEALHFNRLGLAGGKINWAGRVSERIEAGLNVDLTTVPPTASDSGIAEHHLILSQFKMQVPDVAKLPVAGVDRLEVVFRLPDVWKHRQIESIAVTGGHVEAGSALSKAFQMPAAEPSTTPASVAATKTAPVLRAAELWRAGTVNVQDLGITLNDLAPGLPPVHFNVAFSASDTPLEPDGLAQNAEPQRVELGNLTIASPYETLRTVARLDTIFINFTLEGLLSRRIDKVEIVSPTLYVGEDLFWYVDYYRKFAAGEIHTQLDVPALAAAGMGNPVAVMMAAEAVAKESQSSTGGAWVLDTLQVHAGKLVLAPKGVPLPGFHQPFPFSFTTRIAEGKFDAEFEIPPDNYTLEDVKMEFRGMRGKVLFNLPFKTKDNNLNETFWVDQIRWKQVHLEKAHLSVTYDANGVYGKFGGEAYEGYIDGAFDIYNDSTYSWDGWISMTNVKSTEITQKMFPSYFVLDGKINGTVVALGNMSELYQADLKFSNASAGRFSIAALNDMIEDFSPKTGAALTDQITRIGLETLRDFEYDNVQGEGRFYGREGTGHLKFIGPSGARNIEVNVFDHRWKDEPKKTTEPLPSDAAE